MRLLFCLAALALSLQAAAADLYSAINRLRAGETHCQAADYLAPLKPRPELERVARDLSRGGELKQGLKDSGYRATRSRALSIKGDGVGAQAAAFLARQGYCNQLQDPGMTEVGVYLDAGQFWIVIAEPFAPSVGPSGPAAAQRVLELVNQARATPRSCGRQVFDAARPVRWSDTLAESARLHAEDMARHNYFSHSGRDGSSPAQRVGRAGYRYRATGENLAAGTKMTPEDAVAGWIRSPSHCANVMNPAYLEMGAAFAVNARSEMGVYWTQAFGAPL